MNGSEGVDGAADRLAFEAQFTAMREVLEGIPGITGTLPQLAGMSTGLHAAGGWMVSFDIEPSPLGLDALVGLTETLQWCMEHHEQIELPEFEAIVFFAAGFNLRVTPDESFDGEGLAVAPDALARAVADHYEQCVAANEDEARKWEQLTVECTDDCRRSRPELAKVDPARFTFDLIDGENSIVAVFLDGRPLAQYRFAEGDDALVWCPVDSDNNEGEQ